MYACAKAHTYFKDITITYLLSLQRETIERTQRRKNGWKLFCGWSLREEIFNLTPQS